MRWRAPELCQSVMDSESSLKVTTATDVWAFAMTVVEVCVSICVSIVENSLHIISRSLLIVSQIMDLGSFNRF